MAIKHGSKQELARAAPELNTSQQEAKDVHEKSDGMVHCGICGKVNANWKYHERHMTRKHSSVKKANTSVNSATTTTAST